jgi:hypothetical protein
VAKKISVSADGIDEAEKRATSADIFALKSLNGTGGSNPPLSATESQCLRILCSNHRIARDGGFICASVVAEKTTFGQVTRNSPPKSLLAN